MRVPNILFLLIMICGCAGLGPATTLSQGETPIDGKPPYRYERSYVAGDHYSYKLVTSRFKGGMLDSVEEAVSDHTVLTDGTPRERIRWRSLVRQEGDTATDHTEIARGVSPYEISLHPDGTIDLPPLDEPRMLGMITDLNTFFVAVSPAIGVEGLHESGDSHVLDEPARGIWTNGRNIVLGQDCIRTRIELVEIDRKKETVRFRTSFMPPDVPCLELARPWMTKAASDDKPNNFQQITLNEQGKHTVIWGIEEFTITSEVSYEDGKVRNARMDNNLLIFAKIGCTEDLETCIVEIPATIHIKRVLELTLIAPEE